MIDMTDMEEDDIRKADPVQTARLIDYPPSSSSSSFSFLNHHQHDDDHRMLQEAMEASRREFHEHTQRLEADRIRRSTLRRELAIPISRLTLWRRSSSVLSDEMLFLDYILDRCRYATRLVEEEDVLLEPPPISSSISQNYDIFIQKLSESRLYKDLIANVLM
jgi:hypothetical protein